MITRSTRHAQLAAEQAAQQVAQPTAQQHAQQPANNNRVVRFASEFLDQDGDSVMSDDTATANAGEAPQTPTRSGVHANGSVFLTPDKNKPRSSVRREVVPDINTKLHSRYPSLNGNSNHKKIENNAYVEIAQKPTTGKPAKNGNTPGPSKRGPSTPSRKVPPPATIQRRKMEEPSFMQPPATEQPPSYELLRAARLGPDSMMKNPVRWFRNANGEFVRDGSLPPSYFGIDQLRAIQPPRAPTPPPEGSQYSRCDTEPLEDDEDVERTPGGPSRRKRKTRAEARAEAKARMSWRPLRRSERIKAQLRKLE